MSKYMHTFMKSDRLAPWAAYCVVGIGMLLEPMRQRVAEPASVARDDPAALALLQSCGAARLWSRDGLLRAGRSGGRLRLLGARDATATHAVLCRLK